MLQRTRRGIQYVEHSEGDGSEMFQAVCKLGLEGIVSNKKEGKTEDKKIRACLLGRSERDDNRMRGADAGKGKLLSQVGDKN